MGLLENYIIQCRKVYEFRIRIAEMDQDGSIDRIESALKAFDVASVSKPKRAPIQEDTDFPEMGPVEVHMIEIECNYPCTPEQIHNVLRERAGIAGNKFVVRTKATEELRAIPDMAAPNKKGESVLANPDLAEVAGAQDEVGIKRLESMLKELQANPSRDYKKEGPAAEKAKTTNDMPQGQTSPVGTKQNKIPSPVKGNK